MIEVNDISFHVRRKTLLNQINFVSNPGELLAIIGPNGAGKSTLLRLLAKEYNISKGSINFFGKNISDYTLKELATFRSVLPQNNSISLNFTVAEIIMMGRYPHFESVPSALDKDIVNTVVKNLSLEPFLARNYHTLSGGEQQRVQMARVLAQIYDRPNGILLLDEPINGLDLLYQQHILTMARQYARNNFCVIAVLHDINIASKYADKILILKNGNCVGFGTPSEVLTEAIIEQTYQVPVRLIHNKEFNHPLIIPKENHS